MIERARYLRERVLNQPLAPDPDRDEGLDGPPAVKADVGRPGLLVLLALRVVDEDLDLGAE